MCFHICLCHSTHAKHHNDWRRFYANLLPHWRYWSYWPISCAPWWKSSAVRTSNQEQSCTCCLLFQNNNSEGQPARMHNTNISDIKKLRFGAPWSSLDMQHRGNGEACNHTSQDASWHLPPTASGQGQASHGCWDTRYKWHRKRPRWSWWRDHGHLPGQDLGPIGQDKKLGGSHRFQSTLNHWIFVVHSWIESSHVITMVGLNPLLISINGQTIDPLMPDQAKHLMPSKSPWKTKPGSQ